MCSSALSSFLPAGVSFILFRNLLPSPHGAQSDGRLARLGRRHENLAAQVWSITSKNGLHSAYPIRRRLTNASSHNTGARLAPNGRRGELCTYWLVAISLPAVVQNGPGHLTTAK